jgi:hypothetical protein
MRWPWTKLAPPPRIPAYKVPVETRPKPREEGIQVEEHDTSKMTETGIFKAWRRMTGQDPK